MDLPATGHDPVLLNEVLEALDPKPDAIIVDCTLGRAGHAKAITARLGPAASYVGLDADPRNLEFAQAQLKDAPCGVRLFHANFAELPDVLRQVDPDGKGVDGILADLGLSTNQLFDARYGLSFAQDMPLDMRIDPRTPRTAADIVNTMREEDLANLLYQLADERFSRRIARKIADARRVSPIKSTEQLADLVRAAIPKRGGAPWKERSEKIDPATRTFMALRMAVNDEIANLSALLERAPKALKPGGRFAVISFHSTEDRMVKLAFRSAEQTGLLKILTKKPLSPADNELARNLRSRSAKLRVAERVAGC
ncbi:MAG TPA: 16S rRNA (cytosine(1402)-N(4))-methyltransferase RsmH [Tepidisphaeraceae bacterium]|nr:16S rRNA (cytosine(1402)-N(4))-methyltransferase RsmH [Tepidisphaeraceae bacterium]